MFLISLALASAVQAAAASPIQPDRPDYTDGTKIVPVGQRYLEFGYRQTRAGGLRVHDYGDQATVRVGLTPTFEARVGIPSCLATGGTEGFGDETLGFKWRFTPDAERKHPAFGLEVNATFPSGARDFRGGQVQTEFRGLIDLALDEDSDLGLNVVFARPAEDTGAYSQLSASASYGRDLGHGYGGFLEAYAILPQVGRVDHGSYLDAGATKLLNPNVQADAYVGHGLNGHANDYFFGVGISLRF